MTSKLNRCYWTAASAGTGSFVYDTTVPKHLSPTNAEAVDGATYAVIAENDADSEWEISIGVYDSGTGTITRDTIVESSNGGAAVDFTAAPKVRMGVPLAADFRSVSAKYLNLENAVGFFNGALDATGDTEIEQALIGGASLSSADFTNASGLNWINANGAGQLEALVVDGCTSLTRIYADNCALTDLDPTSLGALVELTVSFNPFSSNLDLSGNANLESMEAESCGFTDLAVSSNPLLTYLGLADNALTEAAVDGILTALDGFGESGGEVDLSAGTSAPPSATGLAAKASLEGKGWTVTVNE